MKPARIPTPQFRTVMVDCPDCDQGQVYTRDYGCTATTCQTCEGTCEVEARCPGCDGEKPLNDEGLCRDCTVPVLVDVEFLPRGGLIA